MTEECEATNPLLIHSCSRASLKMRLASFCSAQVFLYCTMWAVGSTLNVDRNNDSKKVFSELWKSAHSKMLKYPDGGTVFDYFIDVETGDLKSWIEKVPSWSGGGGERASEASEL